VGHWLAPAGSAKQLGTVKRFDPVYWTVDFPRPMMASVVTAGAHALRVDAVFHRADHQSPFRLIELAPGVTTDEVAAKTTANYQEAVPA